MKVSPGMLETIILLTTNKSLMMSTLVILGKLMLELGSGMMY